jgi:hypothetical protein
VVEHLPNKHKALIQFLIPQKKKKKKERKVGGWGWRHGSSTRALQLKPQYHQKEKAKWGRLQSREREWQQRVGRVRDI